MSSIQITKKKRLFNHLFIYSFLQEISHFSSSVTNLKLYIIKSFKTATFNKQINFHDVLVNLLTIKHVINSWPTYSNDRWVNCLFDITLKHCVSNVPFSQKISLFGIKKKDEGPLLNLKYHPFQHYVLIYYIKN